MKHVDIRKRILQGFKRWISEVSLGLTLYGPSCIFAVVESDYYVEGEIGQCHKFGSESKSFVLKKN